MDAQLLSEARKQPDPCHMFFGHPDGFWVLTVRGSCEGETHTMRLLLDAATGEHLCGGEINLQA